MMVNSALKSSKFCLTMPRSGENFHHQIQVIVCKLLTILYRVFEGSRHGSMLHKTGSSRSLGASSSSNTLGGSSKDIRSDPPSTESLQESFSRLSVKHNRSKSTSSRSFSVKHK